MNIPKYIDLFRNEITRKGFRPATIKNYVSCIEVFLTDINLIQKLAGHSSVKTTLLYTHISHNLVNYPPTPKAMGWASGVNTLTNVNSSS